MSLARSRRGRRFVVSVPMAVSMLAGLVALAAPVGTASASSPVARPESWPSPASRACPPRAAALGFSDGLDKAVVDGVTVGGLSDIAWDRRRHAYASTVDNHATDPSRIWFWRDPAHAHVVGQPLVLEAPDGTPYTGATADDEGLAVLPNGDYLVSSETEPSIRIFGRDGVQRAELPVPARFAVAPAGEATANATLEGLTVTPDGRHVVASMEGTLSGDVGTDGNDTYRRFLVYDHTRAGWALARQVAYQVEPGNRVAEVQAYGRDGLLVLEAAFDVTTGNSVELYAVHTAHAVDVTDVPDLADVADDVMPKALVADVTACPSLGATAKETQTNPLMDNFEGMTIGAPLPPYHRGRGDAGTARVTLISDDNFSATQTTRVLRLVARLP
ncbi:MAG: esterase-like activity of phytase family protein [Nocardioides sp.]